MSKTIILIHGAWLNAGAWGRFQGPLRKEGLHRHRPVLAAKRCQKQDARQ
jgi:pimeloyl-ACP methyl ester carboxylesterase